MSKLSPFSPSHTNATVLPSGERAGSLSLPGKLVRRTTFIGGRFDGAWCRKRSHTPAANQAKIVADASHQIPFLLEGWVPCDTEESAIHSNCETRSFVLCQRSAGSLLKHFFTRRSNASGAIGRIDLMGAGSSFRIAALILAMLSHPNACRPAT